MGTGTKVMAGVGIAGATAVGIRGLQLHSMGKKLQITHRARIDKISLTGMSLSFDVVIQNPTSNGITIKYPLLKVMLGKKQLAASDVQDKDIVIKPNGTTEINKITFTLTTVKELSILASLIMPLLTGQPIQVKAVTETGVKFLFWHIPFSIAEDIALNNSGNAS
ncbi:MAG TPA: hypothetical protein VK809_08870 [Bacteroidia bacterium]|jgi:hypothetical protein|nr:hypothetical protein [Bacteroidia bacterium]